MRCQLSNVALASHLIDRGHTSSSILSAHLLTDVKLALQLIDWGLLPRAFLGVLALLCGNGYIVGINQIFDDDIDKVNKPFLPIASGKILLQRMHGKDLLHASCCMQCFVCALLCSVYETCLFPL